MSYCIKLAYTINPPFPKKLTVMSLTNLAKTHNYYYHSYEQGNRNYKTNLQLEKFLLPYTHL